jgi:hypothetical protein
VADACDRVLRDRHGGAAAGSGDRAGEDRGPDYGVECERLSYYLKILPIPPIECIGFWAFEVAVASCKPLIF